jgi:hypothetical protein
MIWWSTYGGFEASNYLLVLLNWMFICKNKPDISKFYQIRQTVTFICKKTKKCRSPGVYVGSRLEVRRSPH